MTTNKQFVEEDDRLVVTRGEGGCKEGENGQRGSIV